MLDKIEFSMFVKHILHYIAGYIVYKLALTITCMLCINLILPEKPDHTYYVQTSVANLVILSPDLEISKSSLRLLLQFCDMSKLWWFWKKFWRIPEIFKHGWLEIYRNFQFVSFTSHCFRFRKTHMRALSIVYYSTDIYSIDKLRLNHVITCNSNIMW